MDKRERLLYLTMTLLQTPRPLTAAEIRVRVPGYPESRPSFRRAFERDKDELRELGIQIEILPGSVVHRGAATRLGRSRSMRFGNRAHLADAIPIPAACSFVGQLPAAAGFSGIG